MRSRLLSMALGGTMLVASTALAVAQLQVQQVLRERLAPLGLDLATSTAEAEVSPWTRVVITPTQILVDEEPLPFALQIDAQGRPEIPDFAKQHSLVTSLYEVLRQRYELGAGLAAITSGASGHGQLSIIVDHRVPYSVVREVLYTAGQAQFGRFDLVVENPWTHDLATVPVGLPVIRGCWPPGASEEGPSFNLTVAITDHGHEVRGSGSLYDLGDAAIACRGGGACAGPEDYDWERLSARVQAIKDRYPDEVQAILVPDSTTGFDVIVRTADTLRWGPALDPQASLALWTQWQQERADLFHALALAGSAP